MNRILGISRSHRFSPNSIDRDNAIFQAVAVALRGSGYEVECVVQEEMVKKDLMQCIQDNWKTRRNLNVGSGGNKQ